MTNNKHSTQQNDVEIKPGDHVTVIARSTQQDAEIKEYTPMGRIKTRGACSSVYPENIDVFRLMAVIPKKKITTELMYEITKNMNYKTNEATLTKLTSKNLNKRRSEGLRELKKHKVLKKIGQRSFIVNPYLIIPPAEHQEKVIKKWDTTKPISFWAPGYRI